MDRLLGYGGEEAKKETKVEEWYKLHRFCAATDIEDFISAHRQPNLSTCHKRIQYECASMRSKKKKGVL